MVSQKPTCQNERTRVFRQTHTRFQKTNAHAFPDKRTQTYTRFQTNAHKRTRVSRQTYTNVHAFSDKRTQTHTRFQNRFRAKREHLGRFYGLLPESQGHKLALTVLWSILARQRFRKEHHEANAEKCVFHATPGDVMGHIGSTAVQKSTPRGKCREMRVPRRSRRRELVTWIHVLRCGTTDPTGVPRSYETAPP